MKPRSPFLVWHYMTLASIGRHQLRREFDSSGFCLVSCISRCLCLFSDCDGVFISGQHKGVVESLNFPNSYPANSQCSWTIQASSGNTINYTFTAFQLETTSISCINDYIKVHRCTLLNHINLVNAHPHPHSGITITKHRWASVIHWRLWAAAASHLCITNDTS